MLPCPERGVTAADRNKFPWRVVAEHAEVHNVTLRGLEWHCQIKALSESPYDEICADLAARDDTFGSVVCLPVPECRRRARGQAPADGLSDGKRALPTRRP